MPDSPDISVSNEGTESVEHSLPLMPICVRYRGTATVAGHSVSFVVRLCSAPTRHVSYSAAGCNKPTSAPDEHPFSALPDSLETMPPYKFFYLLTSIINAELHAILLALDVVRRSKEKHFLLLSDTYSSLIALGGSHVDQDTIY